MTEVFQGGKKLTGAEAAKVLVANKANTKETVTLALSTFNLHMAEILPAAPEYVKAAVVNLEKTLTDWNEGKSDPVIDPPKPIVPISGRVPARATPPASVQPEGEQD